MERRALFVECCQPTAEPLLVTDIAAELRDVPNAQLEVTVVARPSLDDLRRRLLEIKPHILYCTGGYHPVGDLLSGQQNPLHFADVNENGDPSTLLDASRLGDAFDGIQIETVYFDALLSEAEVASLRAVGSFGDLVYWPQERQMCSAVGAQFAHAFLAMLRNPSTTFAEAFAMASRSVQLLCDNVLKERPHVQLRLIPSYVSSTEPELPQGNSVPLEPIPDVTFLDDDVPDVQGWENVLLLAPKAEVRLLLCGGPSMIDASRLSLLGEALRALLLTEMRSLTVDLPSNFVQSSQPGLSAAVRCSIRCASGIETVVVLGGPPPILSNRLLVQHALRQTLVVDSLCLQFRLPPPTFPPTNARSSTSVAGGTPVVDTLVVTSVWAVHVLRGLCQDRAYRGLVSLGIAGVGGNALVRFKPSDTERYNAIVTGMQNPPLAPTASVRQENYTEPPVPRRPRSQSAPIGQNGESNLDLIESLTSLFQKDDFDWPLGIDNESDYDIEMDPDYDVSSKTSRDQPIVQMPNISALNYKSNRSLLSRCSETEFYDDLVAFLEALRGKSLDRERFPEAVLNGCQLDLFNLYKEVVSRGGFRVGNGINWKGQVFPKMKNWTANHRMTGVGNALKRHYQTYLCEYEMVHPKDLTGDGCWLCGSSDESGTDWICCDHCERWIHFACDRRPFLGTFKDYATGDGGRTYHCPRCADLLKRP